MMIEKTELEKFITTLKKYKNVLFFIPGSPDPDAMASSFALQMLLKHYSVDSDIASNHKLSLSQNIEFAKKLDITIKDFEKISHDKYDAYGVTDYQNNVVEGITGRKPCAFHIDHHEVYEQCEESDFSIIDRTAGSASTIVALLIKELNPDLDKHTMALVATALIFGIQTDTDTYTHSGEQDVEALKFLTPFAIEEIIKNLNVTPIESTTILYYKTGMAGEIIYKDWGIYPAGYIDSKHRDSLAIAADMILKKKGLQTIVVFGIVEDTKREGMALNALFRTNDPKQDLDRLIKSIAKNGGGRKFKGAFQVDLDFFHSYSDREELLNFIERATIEKLKRAKDGAYVTVIKTAYTGIIRKFASFLKK